MNWLLTGDILTPGIYCATELFHIQFCTFFSFITLINTTSGPLLFVCSFMICYENLMTVRQYNQSTQRWASWSCAAQLVKLVIVKACGLLTTGDNRAKNACSPLSEGTWLSNISVTCTGWSCAGGRSLWRWNVLQHVVRNENNRVRRGNPIREELGSLDWITGHFQNISSFTCCPDISCKLMLYNTAFSSHSTTCDLKPRPTSGHRGILLYQLMGG